MKNIIPWRRKRRESSFDEPLRNLPARRLHQEIGRLFERFFEGPWDEWFEGPVAALRGWNPPIDLTETNDEIIVRFELPGVRADDVEINLTENVLTVSGEKKESTGRKQDSYQVVERRFGSFRRSIRLPSEADPERATAEFNAGVLSVRVGKLRKTALRRIQVRNGTD